MNPTIDPEFTPCRIPLADLINLLSCLTDADSDHTLDRIDAACMLAEHLISSDRDADAFAILASFDICPIHHCDLEICADDDETICRRYRA